MINYVSAGNGKLELHDEDHDVLHMSSDNPVLLAEFVRMRGGFAETVMGSSTMDFASEEGFETNDCASLLLKRVFELV